MSMELSVLSDLRLATTEEWQRAIAAEGFALTLDATVVLDDAKGFFPAPQAGHRADAVQAIELAMWMTARSFIRATETRAAR